MADQHFFRRFFSENRGLKILSLAVALALYSLVHGSQETERTLEVRLDALPPREGSSKIIVNSLPPRVRVTLRGPKILMIDLQAEDLGHLEIDLRREWRERIELSSSQMSVPPGIQIVQIDPPFLDLEWDELAERDVPIQASILGTPPKGYVLRASPQSDPAWVRVRGPKRQLMLMQHVRAEAFDISQVTEPTSRQLALEKPGIRMDFDRRWTQVKVDVGREIVERSFSQLKVHLIAQGNALSARLTPARIDVKLFCAPDIAKTLQASVVVPQIEVVSKDVQGSVSIPVAVPVPGCESSTIPSNVLARW